MHALIENGAVVQYPYGLAQLKSANPLTSFPSQANDEMLASYGVQRVFNATPPELTDTQVLEEGTPVFSDEDQRWTQVFTVRDMTVEEVASRNEAQAANVRSERNTKLAASDWTQVEDAPVDKAAWVAYRQALRDITAQTGFPWTIDWPTQP
jgi:hypothetical protein